MPDQTEIKRLVIYEDEDIRFSCTFVPQLNSWNLHTDVKKWSLSKFKKYKEIFRIASNRFKEKGVQTLYAVPPSEKEEKWQKAFGFRYYGLIDDVGNKIMEYRLWD